MKFILIITLISLVAVLGCTPVPKQATDDQTETADPSFEEAMAGYEPGEWIENWDDALKYAKEMKRPIFINFTGSDWCGWCVKLTNEVFSQKAFVDFAKEKFILLKLDFPRKIVQSVELKTQNQLLQRQFGIQGYPTLVIVDPNGKEIVRTSYQPGGADAYVAHLKTLLEGK